MKNELGVLISHVRSLQCLYLGVMIARCLNFDLIILEVHRLFCENIICPSESLSPISSEQFTFFVFHCDDSILKGKLEHCQ